MIKVLWLEDEVDKIEAFIDRLHVNGIVTVYKKTVNDFIVEINDKFNQYDAVILDVMGIIDHTDQMPSSKAYKMAYEAVLALRPKKNIPFFVFSAQLTKDENQGLKEYIGDAHIYIKSKDEDRLIKNIKTAVEQHPDFILRMDYGDVLSVFNENQLGEKHFERIFELIKLAESSSMINNSADQLISIRKIIEAIFQSLGNFNLVPGNIIDEKGWLNGTSLFLANKHNNYKHITEDYIHPAAAHSIYRLLNITQDGAHSEGGLRLKIDEYIQNSKSDYLFRSCIFLLFDLIIWYKNLTQKHNNPLTNKSLWQTLDANKTVQMILQKDASNNYHCHDILITYKEVKEKGYQVGDMITIVEIGENTKDITKEEYKKVAFKTQKA